MTAVTNSGPLIVLAKIHHLHLLASLYGTLIIPQAVYREVVEIGRARGYPDAETIQAFLSSVGWQPMKPNELPAELTSDARLGKGELEAIALAWQHRALLLMDEIHARSVAEGMGLQTAGSLGILVEAHREGYLPSGMLEELLATIESRKDIWIHPDLCRRVGQKILGK